MNGYERVMTAMRRGQPDRVPIIETSIDAKVIDAVVPGGDMPAFVEKLDLDAIGCGPFYRRDDLPGNRYRDEWGTIYHADPQLLGSPLDGPIHAMADFRRWTPPDPLDPERLGNLPAYVKQFKGKRAVVWHQREAFMTTALLSGLERFLMMLYDEPDLVRAMVEAVVDVHVRLVRRAVRAGADIVSLGDDYAWRTGPMMSVAMFREFFMPGMARVVAAAHEEGALVLKALRRQYLVADGPLPRSRRRCHQPVGADRRHGPGRGQAHATATASAWWAMWTAATFSARRPSPRW